MQPNHSAFRILAALLIVSSAGLAAGCGDDSSGADGDATAIGDDAGSGADVDDGPDLPTCIDNLDCRGGEVCRDGYCRESCEAGDPCTGVLLACDLIAGICVECTADADCGANAECVNQACEFACTSDAACGAGEFCNLATGGCQPRECTSDVDCRGGFRCEDSVCVSIDDVICEPGSLRCSGDGDSVIACSADGTRQSLLACEGGERCVETDGGASCGGNQCEPNEVGCIDEVTAFVCDGAGGSLTELPCNNGQLCVDGTCRAAGCSGRYIVCEGDAVVTCAGAGATAEIEQCATTSDCVFAANGCTCLDGACEPRVCEPGSRVCAGLAVQTCTGDGLAYSEPVACPDGEVCSAGSCFATGCGAADVECELGEFCVEGECRACDCPDGASCNDAGECISDGPVDCGSDAECAATARSLGGDGAGAACDSEVGCFTEGVCNGDGGVAGLPADANDVFNASCPSGSCALIVDLLGGGPGFRNACTCNTVADCRGDETCVDNLLDITGTAPRYCASSVATP
jgi:hypothetical protein